MTACRGPADLLAAAGKNVRWVAWQLGHANPEPTLRFCAHAVRKEQSDLSFLDFPLRRAAPTGGAKRQPRGTNRRAAPQTKTPPRPWARGGFVSLEHETGFEPATLTLAT